MYEENGSFVGGEDAFSQTHLPKCSNNFFSMEMQSSPYPQNDVAASYALEMELQMHHLEIEQCFDGRHHVPAPDNFNQIYAADLLNMFHLPPQPIDERERNVGAVFEFTAQNRDGGIKQYSPTEKYRRRQFTEKYDALKSLLPTPTKKDRASILGDAISYINELKRTVTELKVLVEKKRYAIEKRKRSKEEQNATVELDPYNGSSHLCSWLHRKSKNTEVDVRIIDDEVTVKLVQQKRINCLLFVSKVLDELQLDLHHVAGGVIGDYYSYLFNSKICHEGSTVYASAVANKVIEVVDKQYAAFPPTTTY